MQSCWPRSWIRCCLLCTLARVLERSCATQRKFCWKLARRFSELSSVNYLRRSTGLFTADIMSEPKRLARRGSLEQTEPMVVLAEPASHSTRLGRLSIYLSGITMLQILISFGMQLYVVGVFGAGVQTDALYAGLTLHTMFKVLLPDTLALVLVPLLASKAEGELREYGWLLFITSGVLFLLLSAVLAALAPLFAVLLVPGFSEAARRLTVSLMRVQIFGLTGAGLTAVLTALHHVRNRFVFPALAVLAGGIVAWAWLLFELPRRGTINLAAWAQVTAFTFPVVMMAGVLNRYCAVQWQPALLGEVWRQTRPILLGKSFGLAMSPVDRILGSYLPSGSIVILALISRFYNAAQRTLVQGVLTPFMPQMSRLAHQRDWEGVWSISRKQLVIMMLIGFGAFLGIVSGALLCLHFVPAQAPRLVAGKISSLDMAKICTVMIFMSGLLVAGCVGSALSNSFIAQGDTRTPVKVAMAALTVGVISKIAGCYLAGIKGMAIADAFWS